MTDQARMEYIDSQLAKQRAESREASTSQTHSFGTSAAQKQLPMNDPATFKTASELQRQPAALGKLQEVDLGADTRWRNEERTRRKIAGEKSLEEEEMEAARAAKAPKKVRLGPDGKPWRSRRKRRASEDVERDRIVEEVMRENRRMFIHLVYTVESPSYTNIKSVEIYDEPVRASPAQNEPDGAADDRIAEAFRQEFMDAVAQRKVKTGPPTTALMARTAAAKKEEEALKGPKLGGSRNARQAMRDMMLKTSKK